MVKIYRLATALTVHRFTFRPFVIKIIDFNHCVKGHKITNKVSEVISLSTVALDPELNPTSSILYIWVTFR